MSQDIAAGNPRRSVADSFRSAAATYGIAVGYCLSGSLLAVINKWAVTVFPYPGPLTALQYATCVLGVLTAGRLDLITHERIVLPTLLRFLPAAAMFYLSVFTNSELLLHANVDTFVVFRSATPIFVAAGESLFLNQPWPRFNTWLSLATIFGGSLVYVAADRNFITATAYAWALAYLLCMTADFVYVKHVVTTIGLSTWGLVLYNNLEALLLFPLELLVMGELKTMAAAEDDDVAGSYWWRVVPPVALSCTLGLSISFFGFACRKAVSATGFTVLGTVNKLLTILINLLVWDKHSNFMGTVGLLVCIGGGILYQQSTVSKPVAVLPDDARDEKINIDEEERNN